MKAIARQLRITPKKLNLIADLVRNRNVSEALNILRFTPKKGAKLLQKVLQSAVSNAENNFKQERDSLYVKEIVVTKGVTMKRSVPISRGRMHPILKRNAHIQVTIGVRQETMPAPEETPKAAKESPAGSKPSRTKKAPAKSAKKVKA